MSKTIYVINPNSTEAITKGINRVLEPLRIPGGLAIECLTLKGAPAGIHSQEDVESVTLPLLSLAKSVQADAAAIVVACFSDPGLHVLKESLDCTVLGIGECGVLTALTVGQTFGVIAILRSSIPRHLRAYGAMGVTGRFAGEIAIDTPVTQLVEHDMVLARMTDAGRRLRDDCGAQVLVMGCAGMPMYREPLQEVLKMPVVEPCQAAVAMATGYARMKPLYKEKPGLH
jgi:Asp/Glu/hydantoin racemase